MSDHRDQFFDNVFNEESRIHTDGFQKQLSYENRIVRRVFNECGVKPPSWGQLVNLCKAETGAHEMGCAWFNLTFPRFPAKLCSKRIGYCGYRKDDAGNKASLSLYQLTIADMMSAKNNILVRAVSKALRLFEVDLESPFAFVFPVVRKFFVAHNVELPIQPAAGVSRVVWSYGLEDGSVLRVEPSTSFFAGIGPDWFEL
jgi:hypothetical protein